MMLDKSKMLVCLQLLTAVFVLVGCTTTSSVTSGAGGSTISEAQSEKYDGPKARIAVGSVIDKTGREGKRSLGYHVTLLQSSDFSEPGNLNVDNVTGSIRDLLTTALFNSNRYIVLERDAIDDVLVEQEFSASARVGQATKIPASQLEGAELLVVAALTGFDPGAAGGGGFPIPIPVGDDDWAILKINFRSSYISMDVRVLDVTTSRVLASVSVEGKARKLGADVGAIINSGRSHIELPVVLSGFSNTPMERAIAQMVDAAVASIVDKTPEIFQRY